MTTGTTYRENRELAVGEIIEGKSLPLTHERVLWYGDGLMTSAAGERVHARANIHTDGDFARGQGLPGAIADGMHTTNWISSMLVSAFGRSYLEHGELRTKYVKPISVGIAVKILGRVRVKRELSAGGIHYELDVWAEDGEGEKLTVGDAVIDVSAPTGE